MGIKNEKNNNEWQIEEWEKMREKLEDLSVKELRELSTKVGIEFTEGGDNVTDTSQVTAKEQFILVLDETDKTELLSEYNNVLENRKLKK